jgi:proteasome lid subunit RPN8/RPN11
MTAVVACQREVLRVVEDHVQSDVDREVGGVLIGTMDECAAVVEAALPALRAVGSAANVTFTHEVWDEILDVVERDHPGRRIVGWYHSHPGFGVFLSEYDRFIHQGFFSDERMLALVVDPRDGQAGWFGWRNGQIEKVEELRTRPAPAASGPAAARSRRPAPVLLAMLLGVVAFAAGHVVADRPPRPAAADAGRLAAAQARVRALEARVGDLQAAAGRRNPAGRRPVVVYRVQRGDTLSRIAAAFYGDGTAFPRIVAANRGLQPNRLAVGQALRIPLDPAPGSGRTP